MLSIATSADNRGIRDDEMHGTAVNVAESGSGEARMESRTTVFAGNNS